VKQNRLANLRGAVLILVTALSACGGGGSGSGDTPNQAPVATFQVDAASGAAPLLVTFDASGSSDSDGTIVSYRWTFGDGQSATGASTTHTYASNGSYTATLTVTDDSGATASVSQTIDITAPPNLPPVAAFTASPASGIAPLVVDFDASGSSDSDGTIVSYQWTFGDGQSATGVSVSHSYTAAATYTAHLSVVDNAGDSGSASQIIEVVPTYTLTGRVVSAAGSDIDGDVNDPDAPYVVNDSFASAQPLRTPLILGGFASATGTGRLEDRFASSGDEYDVYVLDLVVDQSVTLSIADHDASRPADNDLDLYLWSISDTAAPVASSVSLGGIESVTVPATGSYYVSIHAYNGISNYVLSVAQSTVASDVGSLRLEHDFVPGDVIVRFAEDAGRPAKAAMLQQRAARLGLSAIRGAPGRAALLRAGKGTSWQTTANALGLDKARSCVPGNMPLSHDLAAKQDTLHLIKALRAREDVVYAEPNYIVQPSLVPNDEYYSLQWHYPLINLPQAWEITTGTPDTGDVIVAVIDTGVVSSHPDLTSQLTDTGYDFISSLSISNDGDGIDPDPEDPGDSTVPGRSSFHGSHVAGTVAAHSDNNDGVAGVSWGARIMPIRVLGVGGGTAYDVAQGIRYAAGLDNDSGTRPTQRADIINLSLGGPAYSTTAASAVQAARDAGVILIAAAGNEASSLPFYPASYSGVVSVSAVETRKEPAPYSNFGADIDVAAPGGDMLYDRNGDGSPDGVLSTRATDISGTPEPVLSFLQGTSMAAPHVAGVAALMQAAYPGLTPDDFDGLLEAGLITEDLGATGRDDIYGHGLIDALAAVEQARELGASGQLPPLLTADPTTLDFGSSQSSLEFTVSNAGTGSLAVTSVNENAAWLSIQPTAVTVNGLGTYTATVDRTGLPDAIYRATITVNGDNGSSLAITALMYVGSNATTGDSGYLYIYLIDPATDDVVDFLASRGTDGIYDYAFSGVLPGTYRVLAGSDSDNDRLVCDPGEACGGYPTQGLLGDITIDNSDETDIDFSVNFPSTLPASASSSDGARTTGQASPGR